MNAGNLYPINPQRPLNNQGQANNLQNVLPPELRPFFTVGKQLGKGGMGVVYAVQHNTNKTWHAMKTIIPAAASDFDSIERFIREAKLTDRLEHQAIVNVQHLTRSTNGNFYIIQDLVQGSDLDKVIKEAHETMDDEERVEFFVKLLAQAARALDYVHGKGVIHRDLKPANLMYDPDTKQVYIMDLGLAKAKKVAKTGRAMLTQGGVSLTKTGDGLGTPKYMAPEQMNDSKDATTAMDIYALGAIANKMFANRSHVEGQGVFGIYNNLINNKISIAGEEDHDPEIPVRIQNVIRKTLATEPQDRYKRAADFAIALEDAYEFSLEDKQKPTTKVNKLKVAAYTTLIALGLGGPILLLTSSPEEPTPMTKDKSKSKVKAKVTKKKPIETENTEPKKPKKSPLEKLEDKITKLTRQSSLKAKDLEKLTELYIEKGRKLNFAKKSKAAAKAFELAEDSLKKAKLKSKDGRNNIKLAINLHLAKLRLYSDDLNRVKNTEPNLKENLRIVNRERDKVVETATGGIFGDPDNRKFYEDAIKKAKTLAGYAKQDYENSTGKIGD